MKVRALTAPPSTKPSPTRGASARPTARHSDPWPTIPADALLAVRERRCPPAAWTPPHWLLPHQPEAARAVASALGAHGVALLADATGLGKTWTALAVATRYRHPAAVVPATLREQWQRTSARTGVALRIVSHESLSRGGAVPAADLLIVDEAHRFRNPATRRYDHLARGVRSAHLLLVTATPVINHQDDLAALLRLGVQPVPRKLNQLLVARSVVEAGVAGLPGVRHHVVRDIPDHDDIVRTIAHLTFPSFGPVGRALLNRHLLYRLGSSLAAAAETIRRHDRYLERLATGSVTRADFRRLVRVDDPQLDLPLDPAVPAAVDLEAERERLAALLAIVRSRKDEKIERLVALRARWAEPTVIFTAATATARAVARALGWRRVALVSGRGARIASGRIPLARALDTFAPRARGTRVRDIERADVLVATDLVSEGLDLQDARRVVHFDLPWTPQRLMQRLGRIARIGSVHRDVEVIWFPPPPCLALPARLQRKASALQSVLATGQLQGVRTPLDQRPRIVRGLLRLAERAVIARDQRMLRSLDLVLERVREGLVVGGERELIDLLSGTSSSRAVDRWLDHWNRRGPHP